MENQDQLGQVGVEVGGISQLTVLHLLGMDKILEEDDLSLIVEEEVEGLGGTIEIEVCLIIKVQVGDAMVVLNPITALTTLETIEGEASSVWVTPSWD